jgi:hypothetical protein
MIRCRWRWMSQALINSMGSHTTDDLEGDGRVANGGRRMFWSMALTSLVCSWILGSGMLWPHGLAATLLAVAAGVLGWTFSILAIARPRYRLGVALVGLGFALSLLFITADRATAANQALSGMMLLILSMFHAPGVDGPHRRDTDARAHLFPLSVEARRFVHGLGWGAVATVVMGAVTLLAMAVRIWPLERPLSVLLAQQVLGRDAALVPVLLVVAVAQLGYGAFCGGLLSTLSQRVDMGDALALGFLRWLATQLIVFSALGWSEFGLEHAPSLALATALPHLAYALSLGWLMGHDGVTGTSRPPRPRKHHLATS